MEKKISVILPVYNEKDNINAVTNSVIEFLCLRFKDYDLIIVDDGSIDGTREILENLSKNNKHIKTIFHKRNIGYGAALVSGLKIATSSLLMFMDSDGQFLITELEKLLPHIDTFDIVIGVRSNRRDSSIRIFLGNIYNLVVCFLFSIKFKDITCGFKLFKNDLFDPLELKSQGGFINAEILVKSKRLGLSVKEVKINHFPRRTGQATGASFKAVFFKIRDIFRLWTDLH